MASHYQTPPMTFSVIPNVEDNRAHAVWDWMIRAAYHDAGRVALRAVCGAEVRPDSQLPPPGAVCADCRAALPDTAMSRPAPGSPMLRELARLHAEINSGTGSAADVARTGSGVQGCDQRERPLS